MRRRMHDHAMADELLQHLLERERARFAVHEREQDDRERVLQRREFVELVEDDVWVGVFFEVDHDADRLFEIALVADAGDAGDFAFVGQLGDFLDHRVAGLLVGDVVDDDPHAARLALVDRCFRADDDRAAAGFVTFPDRVLAADNAAGGEVGSGDVLHEFADGDVRIVEQRHNAAANFAQVVGRDRGGHADGDAARAVDQQVGIFGRQDDGLQVAFVVGGDEVDRVELQVFEEHRREGGHAGFGVPHGGRGEAGDRAEVSLLVDQGVSHVPFLGHADERGVDDGFAVRMVVTAGVAGDLGAFDAGGAGREVEVVHRHEDAALRGLETVAHVGQRRG